jgi:hypothetical protein
MISTSTRNAAPAPIDIKSPSVAHPARPVRSDSDTPLPPKVFYPRSSVLNRMLTIGNSELIPWTARTPIWSSPQLRCPRVPVRRPGVATHLPSMSTLTAVDMAINSSSLGHLSESLRAQCCDGLLETLVSTPISHGSPHAKSDIDGWTE